MTIRVGVNGYGVIGKRVADAVKLQTDMELIGVGDVADDWRIGVARAQGVPIYLASGDGSAGSLEDMARAADLVIDCTPKGVAAKNTALYRQLGVKFIVQGGEKHGVAGHSFVADVSYASALDRHSTRVVSCNTTSIVRVFGALRRAGLLRRARGTLLRRALDPWESHLGGIMNTLVPEAHVPSHQGPDARTVDPALDVVTMAVKVPETLGHMHFWSADLNGAPTREQVRDVLSASPRIAFVREGDGLGAINAVKERMLDLGRPRGDLYEVAILEEALTVENGELFCTYMVDNQAIVIPETIDAIRALMGGEPDAAASMAKTNRALAIAAA
ncbi:MAG: type II glyceraldehyde-3-phosphate dehydrogenase [Hyphomonadaceae bacterium]|nr:type II glyceraldehyde-3-phosphate dehydrogenase [Hyphomonadaceae bacterium]